MSLRQLEEHDKYYSPVISDGLMSYCYIILFYMCMILAANAWMGLTETCVRLTSMNAFLTPVLMARVSIRLMTTYVPVS